MPSTADGWFELGENYYFGRGAFTMNDKAARKCFNKALGKNRYHVNSLFKMGEIYRHGYAVKADKEFAIKYYIAAASAGHCESAKALLKLSHPGYSTAIEWYGAGEEFNPEGKFKGTLFDTGDALSMLGWGVLATPVALVGLGYLIYEAFCDDVDPPKPLNNPDLKYIFSRACYELALSVCDNKHDMSAFRLAQMYKYGNGVKADLSRVRCYYEISVGLGCSMSLQWIAELSNPGVSELLIEHWMQTGLEYWHGRNGVSVDNAMALRYFEKVQELSHNKHAYSAYNIAVACFEGYSGVAVDPAKAKKYFEQAALLGNQSSIVYLARCHFTVSSPTAEQICETGISYDKPDSYELAALCYEASLDKAPNHAPSLYRLGSLTASGNGVVQSRERAIDLYGQAADRGHFDSAKLLLGMQYNGVLSSAREWSSLGHDYYYARSDKQQDYTRARACFVIANEIDDANSKALFMLGRMHQHGQGGLKRNLRTAEVYYTNAERGGSDEAVQALLKLHHRSVTSANDWFELGQNYYFGRAGITKNERRAKNCYTLATQVGRQEEARFILYALPAYKVDALKLLKGHLAKQAVVLSSPGNDNCIEWQRFFIKELRVATNIAGDREKRQLDQLIATERADAFLNEHGEALKRKCQSQKIGIVKEVKSSLVKALKAWIQGYSVLFSLPVSRTDWLKQMPIRIERALLTQRKNQSLQIALGNFSVTEKLNLLKTAVSEFRTTFLTKRKKTIAFYQEKLKEVLEAAIRSPAVRVFRLPVNADAWIILLQAYRDAYLRQPENNEAWLVLCDKYVPGSLRAELLLKCVDHASAFREEIRQKSLAELKRNARLEFANHLRGKYYHDSEGLFALSLKGDTFIDTVVDHLDERVSEMKLTGAESSLSPDYEDLSENQPNVKRKALANIQKELLECVLAVRQEKIEGKLKEVTAGMAGIRGAIENIPADAVEASVLGQMAMKALDDVAARVNIPSSTKLLPDERRFLLRGIVQAHPDSPVLLGALQTGFGLGDEGSRSRTAVAVLATEKDASISEISTVLSS